MSMYSVLVRSKAPADQHRQDHLLPGFSSNGYPDINKMSILGDVAPYSREYQKYAGIVRRHSGYDSDLRAE